MKNDSPTPCPNLGGNNEGRVTYFKRISPSLLESCVFVNSTSWLMVIIVFLELMSRKDISIQHSACIHHANRGRKIGKYDWFYPQNNNGTFWFPNVRNPVWWHSGNLGRYLLALIRSTALEFGLYTFKGSVFFSMVLNMEKKIHKYCKYTLIHLQDECNHPKSLSCASVRQRERKISLSNIRKVKPEIPHIHWKIIVPPYVNCSSGPIFPFLVLCSSGFMLNHNLCKWPWLTSELAPETQGFIHALSPFGSGRKSTLTTTCCYTSITYSWTSPLGLALVTLKVLHYIFMNLSHWDWVLETLCSRIHYILMLQPFWPGN